MVTPIKEKGQVFVEKDDQGLTIFVYMNRLTSTRTEEIYVFPGEATFKKCKSSNGRVYLLKLGDRREFFWMQDKDDSKDDENATKLNAVLTGQEIPAPSSSSPVAAPSGGGNSLESLGLDPEEIAALNALDPEEREQTLQMLGLVAPPAAATPAPSSAAAQAMDVETPTVSATPAAPPPVRPAASTGVAGPAAGATFSEETLRNVMAGVGSMLQAQQQQQQDSGVNLTDVLGREQLDSLLGEEDFVSAMLPLLPEGEQSLEGLKANISSPQFKEALASFTAVLSSEDAAAVMGQFGVDPVVVAQNGGGAVGLLAAIQAKIDKAVRNLDNDAMDESTDA